MDTHKSSHISSALLSILRIMTILSPKRKSCKKKLKDTVNITPLQRSSQEDEASFLSEIA